MLSLTIRGVIFQYPEVDDEDWGTAATNWADAVTTTLISMKTAVVPPIANVGVLCLGNEDRIAWRDNADTTDVYLTTDANNALVYHDYLGNDFLLSQAAPGNVSGPVTSSANSFPVFSDSSGQLLSDSGLSLPDLLGALVPLGVIIPHYDFGANLAFDSSYWALCNGQVKTINGRSETLPDMSGRYLVGFGTDGGADIGSATWNVSAVGQAGHLSPSLAHVHSMNAHTHAMSNHQHTISHTHEHTHTHSTTFSFPTTPAVTGRPWSNTTGNGAGWYTTTSNVIATGQPDDATTDSQSTNNSGWSGTASGGVASPANTVTALTTVSIQPSSIRVRYIMRIK